MEVYRLHEVINMLTITVNIVSIFAAACLFWSIILIVAAFNKTAYINKKAKIVGIIFAVILQIIGIWLITI